MRDYEVWGILGSDGTNIVVTTNMTQGFRFKGTGKTIDVVSYVMFPDLATHPALLRVGGRIGKMSKGSYTKSEEEGPSLTLEDLEVDTNSAIRLTPSAMAFFTSAALLILSGFAGG